MPLQRYRCEMRDLTIGQRITLNRVALDNPSAVVIGCLRNGVVIRLGDGSSAVVNRLGELTSVPGGRSAA